MFSSASGPMWAKCRRRPRSFPREFFRGGGEPRRAVHFVPPDGELQAEGDGLRMNAVGPADLKRVFVPEAEALTPRLTAQRERLLIKAEAALI